MNNFDPPEPPATCRHGTVWNVEYCEKCEDAEATRANEIIRERKDDES